MGVIWAFFICGKESSTYRGKNSLLAGCFQKNFFLVYRGAPVEQTKTPPRIRRSIGPGAVIAFKFLGLNTIADRRVIISIDKPILKGWSHYDGQTI